VLAGIGGRCSQQVRQTTESAPNVIAVASRVIEKIGPEQLSQGISSMVMRAVSGNNVNKMAYRVGLPSSEAAEEFITRSPGSRPEVADDLKEWLSNMTAVSRGGSRSKESSDL
jgi:hypothetical protein